LVKLKRRNITATGTSKMHGWSSQTWSGNAERAARR
jgi:hypothetical protein